MNTFKCISNDVCALSTHSTAKEIKQMFKYLTFTHLPVIDNKQYIGSIAEKDLLLLEKNEEKIQTYSHLLESFFAEENMSWLELLKLFATNDTNVLPVLNSEKQYVGYYELNNVLHLFYDTPFLNENGAIIIIEKEMKDYSFSEISQIVESNDCNLLGMFISDVYDDKVQITLKMGYCNISSITETFSRYGYQLLTSFHDDEFLENLKNRSEYLQKYLNM
ncbi:MAG: acetoin utilization protein acuB [Flavobacteriaceae bacterium]|nr:acetoin utilization protein acuB [Flavobacteriaceae bacterium]